MRALRALTIVAMLVMADVASFASPAAAAPQYDRIFDALWSTVNTQFYAPDFLGHDWKAIGAHYRAKLPSVHTDKQFAVLASQMLGELGVSHLDILPPLKSSASDVGIGILFQKIAGEEYVSTIDPLSDARRAGLEIGDRLLSPHAALAGAPGSTATVEVQGCSGSPRTLHVKREGAFWPPMHPGLAWYPVEVGPDRSIGYLRIGRFDDGAAPLIDQAMEELRDTKGLIIDVRENSGGNLSATRLLSYFSGPARIEVALFSRPYLEKLGHPVTAATVQAAPKVTGAYTTGAIQAAVVKDGGGAVFLTEDMGKREYTKPVVVLIGPNTGSAAEGFAAAMKFMTKATLVGRKTAGLLLSSQDFDLPGGWKAVVPIQGLWAADGTNYRDRPTAPDVAVEWTRADLCHGRDPDIEKALAILSSSGSR